MKTNLLKFTLVAAIVAGSLAPLTASADPYHKRHHRYKHHHSSKTKVVIVNPRPVVVAPAPVVVAPAPVVVDRGYYSNSVQIDVQRALARRGYYGGVIDGDIGPRTRAAIRTYQVDRGLPVTGVIDTPLLRSLRLI